MNLWHPVLTTKVTGALAAVSPNTNLIPVQTSSRQDHIIMPIYPSLHQYLYLRVNTYIVTPVSYPHTSTDSLTPVPTSSCQHLHPHTSTQLSCQSLDPHTSIIDLRHYLHSCTSTHIIGTILTSLCCYSCIQASTHLVRSSFSSLLASFIACCRWSSDSLTM